MEIITSRQNSLVKLAVSLKEKKNREAENLLLIESEKLVLDAINSGFLPYKIFTLNDKFGAREGDLVKVTREVMDKITDLKNVQVAAIFHYKFNENIKKNNGNFLVLDNIQDPNNLGAIIRSAAAFDFKSIYKIGGVDSYNSKVIRSSMGNLFKVSIIESSYDEIDKLAKEKEIFIADLDGESIDKCTFSEGKTGIVIGNEGNGISDEILNLNLKKINIPMANKVESLNAAVSASVIMYEVMLRRN